MVAVPPSDVERYNMRLLLCYTRGPVSFDDLRTVDGIVYTRYKDAAVAAGLLDGDEESDKCLREATLFRMPSQLRHLFATLLVFCNPTDARKLWDDHLPAMSEDIMRAQHVTTPTPRVILQVLKAVERCLQSSSTQLSSFPDLPQIADFAEFEAAGAVLGNRLIEHERSYDPTVLAETLSTLDALTSEQRGIYEEVVAAVDDPERPNRLFLVDGPGGTGKSFLMEKLLAKVRVDGGIALAVASCGIAAQLLTGGRTAHSRFKIKLELDETSTYNIPVNSQLADLIRECKLIVWDEAPMMHRHALESVDRTLQLLMGDTRPFGGKVVLLAGDFRQILPVVPRAGDAQIIAASIKTSKLWRSVQSRHLTVNTRVRGSPGDAATIAAFASLLLQYGDGRHESHSALNSDAARIPSDLLLSPAEEDMGNLIDTFKLNARRIVDYLYADVASVGTRAFDYLCDRAILAPKNVDVEEVNNEVMRRLPGDEREYLSIDTVECEEEMQRELYPVEFLNTIDVSGLPAHRLRLKEGASVLLKRNLDPERGLCNGTRLLVCRLATNCLHAIIMNGSFKGQSVLIPRIGLISRELGLPFQIRRKQFPVQVAFAMTINKAQGQSIPHLAVYLPQPVFAHGQLYVALSRATARANVKVLIRNAEQPDGPEGVSFTKNIVYRDVIRD